MNSKRFSRFVLPTAALAALGLSQPAAAITYYNLTKADSLATINSGVFATPTSADVVGTGVIKPFIRIQGAGGCSTNCVEQGYNTDGDGTGSKKGQFDAHDNMGSNWNRSLALSTIPIVTHNTIAYREFILDINENNNATDSYLSLDKFQLYLASTGNLEQFNPATQSFSDGTATLIYDLGDNAIGLDYALNSGSGKGVDLVARIPDALFKDPQGNYISDFVYLYSSFGDVGVNQTPDAQGNCTGTFKTCTSALPPGDFGHTSGFEEWSTRVNRTPEPGSLFLLGLGVAALVVVRKRTAKS